MWNENEIVWAENCAHRFTHDDDIIFTPVKAQLPDFETISSLTVDIVFTVFEVIPIVSENRDTSRVWRSLIPKGLTESIRKKFWSA